MSTPVEELVSACFDELQLSQRFKPYVQRAEDAGYPQLAKLFRALVASETAREALFRKGVIHHADEETGDYFVCPHCGLVYHFECPDQCVVDQTPSADFIIIQ
jgi:rubrerythrin